MNAVCEPLLAKRYGEVTEWGFIDPASYSH